MIRKPKWLEQQGYFFLTQQKVDQAVSGLTQATTAIIHAGSYYLSIHCLTARGVSFHGHKMTEVHESYSYVIKFKDRRYMDVVLQGLGNLKALISSLLVK